MLLSRISFSLLLATSPCLASKGPPPLILFMWLGVEWPHHLAHDPGLAYSILLATGEMAINRHRTWVKPLRLNSGTFAGSFKKGVDGFYLGCWADRLQAQSSLWLSLPPHRKSLPENKGNIEESRAEKRREPDFWKACLLETWSQLLQNFSVARAKKILFSPLKTVWVGFHSEKVGLEWNL